MPICRAVDFLAGVGTPHIGRTRPRVEDHLIAEREIGDTIAEGVDNPAPSAPRTAGQRSLGEAAGDEDVQMVESHVAEADPHLAGTGSG